ncbi:hypothetical protein [Rhizobium gallicum]|nr:hypothetical protein [Rhizobium gallicum]
MTQPQVMLAVLMSGMLVIGSVMAQDIVRHEIPDFPIAATVKPTV